MSFDTITPAEHKPDNQVQLKRLVRILTNVDGFALYFVQCESAQQRKELIEQLQNRLAKPIIEVETGAQNFNVTPIDLLITQHLASDSNKKNAVVCVTGLDIHLPYGDTDAQTRIAQHFNLRRTKLGKIKHPILLWGSKTAIRAFAQGSPDLWDWNSGIFEFVAPITNTHELILTIGDMGDLMQISNLSQTEKDQWLRSLHNLIDETEKSGNNRTLELAELWQSVGAIEWARSNTPAARTAFQNALNHLNQGSNSSIYHLQQRARLQHYLASTFANSGDFDVALALYQKALDDEDSSQDIKGKSATLHAMAYVVRTRGDLDAAMALYRQSLDIKEKLGDLKGKSATLHQMAYVLVTRGDLDGAMALYRQSLDLDEQLGDLQGKASTLAMLAQIHSSRQEYEQALQTLVESLNLFVAMGAMPDANKVAGILDGFKQQLGPAAFAALWRQALGETPQPEWLN